MTLGSAMGRGHGLGVKPKARIASTDRWYCRLGLQECTMMRLQGEVDGLSPLPYTVLCLTNTLKVVASTIK